MLHIVQAVLSGSAESPKVYLEEAAAHAAFVGCAKTYWASSYAAYCDRNGVDPEKFASAQAFVASFDLADRSRIYYWTLAPEDASGEGNLLLPGVAVLAEGKERIEELAHEVRRASDGVQAGVAALLDTIAELTGGGPCAVASPSGGGDAPGRLAPAEPEPQEAPQPPADQYKTKEWKEYVASIMNMCGGNRSEFHLFTRENWRQAVYSNATSFEYWDWVAATIDHYIEKAQHAGYSVIDDPDHPGRYRFKTPDGVVSEVTSEAQGEAWCRAGLHLEGK